MNRDNVRIINGKKPTNYLQMDWGNDLKEFGIMLHTIFNPFNNWWGIEFVRKFDNVRKCVVFNDRMKATKEKELEVYKAFRRVEKFFKVPKEVSKYHKAIKEIKGGEN